MTDASRNDHAGQKHAAKVGSRQAVEALQTLCAALAARLGAQLRNAVVAHGDLNLLAARESFVDVVNVLRTEFGFVYFLDMFWVEGSGPDARFDVIYHLLSPERQQRIRLKVSADQTMSVPSLAGVFSGASRHEHMIHQDCGITFRLGSEPHAIWPGKAERGRSTVLH